MWMTDYISAIQAKLVSQYGFAERPDAPGVPVDVPDGQYLMEIAGKLDHVRIVDGKINCCNFENRVKMDKETIQTLLDLLNPLHGSLDLQTYDEKVKQNFDGPPDAEHEVTITSQHEHDLSQAVCILEDRLRNSN
jgi:hypothetical protein